MTSMNSWCSGDNLSEAALKKLLTELDTVLAEILDNGPAVQSFLKKNNFLNLSFDIADFMVNLKCDGVDQRTMPSFIYFIFLLRSITKLKLELKEKDDDDHEEKTEKDTNMLIYSALKSVNLADYFTTSRVGNQIKIIQKKMIPSYKFQQTEE